MNLESIILTEVSQKEKNKYHIYEILKGCTEESICRETIETQAQRTDLWTQWGKKRVGQIQRLALKHIHYHM